jgi:hypothetical protein
MMKLLTAALLLLAAPAFAEDDGSYTTVGEWSIYRNTDECSALATYEDNEIVGFFYDAKEKTTRVMLTYKDGTSLKNTEKRTLAIYIIRPNGRLDDGWDSVKFTVVVGSDGLPSLISQPLEHPALDDFKKALKIGFYYNDKMIGSYNLKGTGAALREVERCSQRLHKINPRDVFAQ